MSRVSCQLTACLMSAVVLLCSVYCACGGQVNLTEHRAIAVHKNEAAHPHCSKHRGEQGRHEPQPSEHGESDHPGCGHCGSTVAVPPTKGGGVDPPDAVSFGIAALALTSAADSTSLAVSGLRQRDLPPRVCDASLLGLHCALTS